MTTASTYPVSASDEGREVRPMDSVPAWKHRLAGIVTALTRLGVVACIGELLIPRGPLWIGLTVDLFYTAFSLPVDASVLMALALLLLAIALRRRKRAALWVLLIMQLIPVLIAITFFITWALRGDQVFVDLELDGVVKHGMKWLVPVIGALAIVVFAGLLLVRPAFPARLAKGAFLRMFGVLVVGFVAVAALGFALTEVFPGHLYSTADRLAWSVNQVIGRIALLRKFGVHGYGPNWVSFLIGLVAAGVLLLGVIVFFASVRSRRLLSPDDELGIRTLLAGHGEQDSLGYFSTRRDKSVAFAPGRGAAVTYRVLGGCTLAGGDPIGDPDAWAQAIRAWLDEAAHYGWMPAVLGASERGARAYAKAGLKARELGDEAILDVREFSLAGPSRKTLRQAVHRLRRAGYTARIRHHADISSEEMSRLLANADAWRGADTERGFSMALGRLGDPADGHSVMAEAYDAQGVLRGLQSFVPWGNSGLSLDVMRRDQGAANGINEYLVAEVIDAGAELGVRRISLNFAMFRSVFAYGERIGAGPVLRAWRAILRWFSRYFQLESLYRSNDKYAPVWEPRFLCYQSTRQLPRVALVAGMAEGFVPSRRRARMVQPRVTEEFLATVRRIEAESESVGVPQRRVPEQMRARLEKAGALELDGGDAYPPSGCSPCPIAEVRAAHQELARDSRTGHTVTVAGRVLAERDFGGLCFAMLRDGGGQLQAMLRADHVGADLMRKWRTLVDIGDQISVTGEVVTSQHGELSVDVTAWTITAKCLHPLPHNQINPRRRYLELMAGGRAMDLLTQRASVLRSVRDSLHDNGFLEVETPMLHAVHGGANARPFVTHSNASDARMYLRIAPELYLKRLCVAGVAKLFELNRNFRNEGVDGSHSPEFTMLEAYQAYADYLDMLTLARELIQRIASALYGSPVVRRGGEDVDIGGEWPIIPVYQAVSSALGVDIDPGTPIEVIRDACAAKDIPFTGDRDSAYAVLHAYDKLVEPNTVAPTFYTDFPAEVSPLTRQHRDDERLAERWDLVAFGYEIGTAYTELTDPRLQRERLTSQSMRAARGDLEAMELDEDFLLALEYGMPPTGGLGLGIDRVMMMLTGEPIRQTITFPFVRQ